MDKNSVVRKIIIDVISEVKEMDINGLVNEKTNIIDKFEFDSLKLITFILLLEEKLEIEMDFETFSIDVLKEFDKMVKYFECLVEKNKENI